MLGEPAEAARTVIAELLRYTDGGLLGRDRLLPLRVRGIVLPWNAVVSRAGAFDGVADLLLLGEDLIDIGLLETRLGTPILAPATESLTMVRRSRLIFIVFVFSDICLWVFCARCWASWERLVISGSGVLSPPAVPCPVPPPPWLVPPCPLPPPVPLPPRLPPVLPVPLLWPVVPAPRPPRAPCVLLLAPHFAW